MPSDEVSAGARGGRVRRVAKVAAVVASCVVAAFAALAVLAGMAMSKLFDFEEVEDRKRLQPIPIDRSACPYVEVMHEAANQFQIASPVAAGFAFDERGNRLTFARMRARLGRSAKLLEDAVTVSAPHFPRRVQRYLLEVKVYLVAGREQLAVARDWQDLSNRTDALFQSGHLSFAYAGDLIGEQCRVPLRADTETMLFPFLSTTSTSAASP
jgi:hypothetical protein